jgi:hypothetical protein
MEWQKFEERFCWEIDKEVRAKTYRALQLFAKKAPDEIFEGLHVHVFAPSGILGAAWSGAGYGWYVYLDPRLELDPQDRVTYTVAHEFAHVVLKLAGAVGIFKEISYHPEQPNEWEVDRLARSWGFYDPDAKREYRFWPRESQSLWE